MASIVFHDNFSETADTLLQNHTPNSDQFGSGWRKLDLTDAPDLLVEGLEDHLVADSQGFNLKTVYFTGNFNIIDFKISAVVGDLPTGDDYLYVMTRIAQSSGSLSRYYAVQVNKTSIGIRKLKNGTRSVLGTDTAISLEEDDEISLVVESGVIKAQHNGITKTSHNEGTLGIPPNAGIGFGDIHDDGGDISTQLVKEFTVRTLEKEKNLYFDAHITNPGWYHPNWPYRIEVKVDSSKVDANLTNFPVYVDLGAFPQQFHDNIEWSDGGDIRVTSGDGQTEIPREVIYDDTTDKGSLFFKGDLNSGTDKSFFVYFGNSTVGDPIDTSTYGAHNVWDDYVAVYHLDDNDLTNSANDNHDLSNSGTSETSDTKVGDSRHFDSGDSDYMDTSDHNDLDISDNLSISFLQRFDATPGNNVEKAVIAKDNPTNRGFNCCVVGNGTNANLRFNINNGTWKEGNDSVVGDTDLSVDTWYHHAIVFDSGATNEQIIYTDGSIDDYNTSSSGSIGTNAANLVIGAKNDQASYNSHFDGDIDEVRISDIARGHSWHLTEYNNLMSPTTFYELGVIYTQTITTDGIVKIIKASEITSDGIIQEAFTKTFTVDAEIDSEVARINVDAIIITKGDFSLGDITPPRPKRFRRIQNPIYYNISALSGKEGRDYSGITKEVYILEFGDLTEGELQALIEHVEENKTTTFSIEHDQLTINEKIVYPYVSKVDYKTLGSDFRGSCVLELVVRE